MKDLTGNYTPGVKPREPEELIGKLVLTVVLLITLAIGCGIMKGIL
jgi:hypothetical protein